MAANATLRVRNFLGIKKADITLDRIVLVAGVNGAGKSSLIEALAAVSLETPLARGMRTKTAAARLLHRGADAGSISLDWAGGGRRIVYPQAEIETAGKPVEIGTSLGIGSAKLMDLKPDARTSQMTVRFKLEPAIDDLRDWFKDKPEARMGTTESEDGKTIDPIAKMWERIELSGWDAVHKSYTERASKIKGAWQAVTNTNWGTRIAKTWTPPEILPGETYDLDAIKASVVDARAEVEALVARQAVAGRDRDVLEALAAGEKASEGKVEELLAEHAALTMKIEALISWLAENPAPADTSSLPKCPHCEKPLMVSMTGPAGRATPKVEAVDGEPKTKAQIKAELAAHEAKSTEFNDANFERTQLMEKIANARAALRAASDAAAELDDLNSNPRPDIAAGALELARETVAGLETKVTAIENHRRAKSYYDEWVRNQLLVEALEPDGVRHAVLESKLNVVNSKLSEYSQKAQWLDVQVTADMDATYDGIPYPLLSESEQWRVDLTLTALLNREEGAHLILVDRLDILAPQSRAGAIFLLQFLNVPALVGMTARSLNGKGPGDPTPVPDLAKLGLGTRHWLKDGALMV